MPPKLFIPGPIDVSAETFQAMCQAPIGHRSPAFSELYNSLQPGLKALAGTQDPVFVSTCSAWGSMEAAVRNCCEKKVLNCMCGAFSDKWHDVSRRCGKDAEALQVEWGQIITPESVHKALSTNQFDAITIVHSETSTGVLNPLPEIMEVVRQFPDVISIVDTVSSFSGMKLEKDAWGIDVMITGSQKALALPPGISLMAVSERALKRAKTISQRGYSFDFIEFLKNHEKGMTPATPAIPLFYALQHKLQEIDKEGLNNRFERHSKLNQKVHDWIYTQGFELFPPKEHATKTLTCVRNTRDIDIIKINQELIKRYNFTIDVGYGKLRGQTFRISNMGDETDKTIQELLDSLEVLLTE